MRLRKIYEWCRSCGKKRRVAKVLKYRRCADVHLVEEGASGCKRAPSVLAAGHAEPGLSVH